ncbi:MAG: TIGR03086 family metal-binding protein [Aeromicrobium sp.]
MTDHPDLQAAARLTASIVTGVGDEQLDNPTPCDERDVQQLLAHIDGLSQAFTAAAAKDFGPLTDTAPDESDGSLGDDWRRRVPAQLAALAQAWSDPSAWEGMTRAGGIDLPGEVGGLVALDEIAIHGWDLAVATGQPYDPDDATAAVVHGFLLESRKEPVPEELFGPVVDVSADARLFDQALGLAGRDPGWPPNEVK